MPTTTEGRMKAARMMMNLAGLTDHPLVRKHLNIDESHTAWDWEGLAEEGLSTGEFIVIDLLRAIVLGHSSVRVADLYQLDDHHRRIAVDALRLTLIGDEVPVL